MLKKRIWPESEPQYGGIQKDPGQNTPKTESYFQVGRQAIVHRKWQRLRGSLERRSRIVTCWLSVGVGAGCWFARWMLGEPALGVPFSYVLKADVWTDGGSPPQRATG